MLNKPHKNDSSSSLATTKSIQGTGENVTVKIVPVCSKKRQNKYRSLNSSGREPQNRDYFHKVKIFVEYSKHNKTAPCGGLLNKELTPN